MTLSTILLGLVIPFGAIILGILILCAVIFIVRQAVPDTIITPFWKNVLIWLAVLIFILWLCDIFGVFHMSINV